MLAELSIENVALFERAALRFGAGLNVITGETGAGKSLLVGALELLIGERPRAALVRKDAAEARVEGRFVFDARDPRVAELASWIDEHLPALSESWKAPGGLERELILGRTVSADGKTRAWIDQRPVTQKTLRELGRMLVEIHGQNEHQRLLEPAEQCRLLDAFGEHGALLEAYRAARARALELEDRLARFESEARERRDRQDLLRFQVHELGAAKLSIDEQRELEGERELLRHAAQLGRELGGVTAELSEAEPAALDVLRRAQRVVEAWEGKITELAAPAEELRASVVHLEEAAASLARFLEELSYSPERLEEVEARLYELERLEQKYRTDLPGLVELERGITAELARLASAEVDEAELAGESARALAELEARAEKLSSSRRSLRARLKKAVEKSLAELGLERASFTVQVEPRAAPSGPTPDRSRPGKDGNPPEFEPGRPSASDPTHLRRFAPDGADEVEFLLAANPGEPPQPLRAVASGGEIARIMLALRTALALRQPIPTLVFDEVDAGVGGRLGPKVGEHLRALAANEHQILCVTHLPAIAALAEHHFKTEKKVAGGRTRTLVAELDGEARVEEVADMIAGGAAHATARAEARRLLAE